MNTLGQNAPAGAPSVCSRRVDEIYERLRQSNQVFTDRLFIGLMIFQWLAAVAIAVFYSPRTWIGAQSAVHIHVWAALLLGGLLSCLPIFLALTLPGRAITRYVIAVAQMLYGVLLIHLTGGRIETHFHVFGSLAFLALYRDWRVLVPATAVVLLDHALRGTFWPMSVFGVPFSSPWRWIEHGAWVAFADVVWFIACLRGTREWRENAMRQALIERGKDEIERQVRERTAELAEATMRAEAATRAKSDFLANMSHELRTPMTAIIGFCDVLLDPATDASDRLNSSIIIRRNGEHLLQLINDILDLSKIEAGQLEAENVRCNPLESLAEVVALLRGRAESKGLALRVRCDGEVPVAILSDPMRLKQALVNLIGNAIKFTDAGRVEITVRCDPRAQRIELDVTDQGIGMSEEQVAKLFRPFSQADATTTRRFGGTGLGLMITRRIARLLGGDVSVRSEAGQGSTFTLRIRTGPLEGVAMTRTAPELLAESPAKDRADLPLVPGRVLLVEDGPDNQRLIQTFLKRAGAEVHVVENGLCCLERIAAETAAGRRFDVILMDMQMPVMDGYTATSRLRADGYGGLIIALTANAMKGEAERCLAAGCDAFLAKPIKREQLLRELARRMEMHEAAQR